ncbi:MAG: O-antigen ligase family protein [Chloroflexi bacterium]|nr:O-antigen ligase family protein [Chloroflexota bacterium]
MFYLILVGLAMPLLLLPGSTALVGVLMLVPALAYAVKSLRLFARANLHPADVAALGLLGMGIVGAVIADDPEVSQPKLLGLLYAISVYFAVRRYAVTLRRATAVAILLTVAGLSIAVVGLVGTQWLDEYSKTLQFRAIYDRIPRLIADVQSSHGTIGGFHPNEVAGVLAALIPISFAVPFAADGLPRGGKLPLTIAGSSAASLALMMFYTAISASRAAWASLGVAAIVSVAMMISPRRLAALAATGFVLMFAVWLLVGPLGGQLRSADDFGSDWYGKALRQARAIAPLLSASDLTWDPVDWGRPTRFEIWERGVQMVRDYPLTGIGLNTFPSVVQSRYPFSHHNDFFVPHAHNLFLQAALDYGLLGLACFVLLLVVAITNAIRSLRVGTKRPLAIGVLGGLVSYASFGILDAVVVGAKPTFLFFAMIAMAISLGRARCLGRQSLP